MSLCLAHGIRIHAGGGVEDDARWFLATHHFFKHAIDYTTVEMHVLVEAGAKAVDEGDCADVQSCLVWVLRTRAVGLQGLLNHPQENT